jgi:mannose-1-phosphate guanylyltransferase
MRTCILPTGGQLYSQAAKEDGCDLCFRESLATTFPSSSAGILGEASMRERTCRRVALSIRPKQTLIVVTKTHQSFYKPVLAEVPSDRVAAQPRDRGTAAALFYALLRLLNVGPTATVAIFPSDHYVADDAAFIRHVELAFDGVRARPDLLVSLGITPDGPEVDYCWIEMGQRIAEYCQLFRVKRFWQSRLPS